MGFTLRAVIEGVPQKMAQITVAEIIREVVDWNKTYFDSLHPGLLDDDRVKVKIGPVPDRIAESNESYHSILLDVDNGPTAFTGEDNDSLYTDIGLKRLHTALKSGGLLAVW